MPRCIGTCFGFYKQLLDIYALVLDVFANAGGKKTKHLHIESIVISHNSVCNSHSISNDHFPFSSVLLSFILLSYTFAGL